jgi:hypothetical protein
MLLQDAAHCGSLVQGKAQRLQLGGHYLVALRKMGQEKVLSLWSCLYMLEHTPMMVGTGESSDFSSSGRYEKLIHVPLAASALKLSYREHEGDSMMKTRLRAALLSTPRLTRNS